MHINFTHDSKIYSWYRQTDSCAVRAMGKMADGCLKSKVLNILTLGLMHTFIHELGHALSHHLLTSGEATINLSTSSCYGSTTLHPGRRSPSSAGQTWIELSGPLADILFSAIVIVGIFALTHYVPMSQALSISLRVIIGAPSAFWIMGELFYSAVSAWNVDNGDFGKIANKGWSHLILAVALLVGICALAALGMAMLW
jgi:hypothetical protein